ncbi:hypothetical protein SUNI508_00497 [Seiridium unicorne]|uniref:Uncharacterized protein n=1 Tax=Seiridium unicorne TaxID=138068 RepID=A0ABR2V718_9PEZI
MSPIPLLLSPALPSELLTYILNQHVYPSTLIFCSTRADFLKSLQDDIREGDTLRRRQLGEGASSQDPTTEPNVPRPELDNKHDLAHQDRLLAQTLSFLAISRHIRTVYIPTVTHLRSYMSVFSPDDSKITAPPTNFAPPGRKPPSLIIYGVIESHRDTSEWSAQGLGNTVAALVETATRLGWGLVLVEPRRLYGEEHDDESDRRAIQGDDDFENLLKEKLPILSGSARRAGLDSGEGGWSGRTVEVGRVISRWFNFQRGHWDPRNDYE